jgi:hypothetical protein
MEHYCPRIASNLVAPAMDADPRYNLECSVASIRNVDGKYNI